MKIITNINIFLKWLTFKVMCSCSKKDFRSRDELCLRKFKRFIVEEKRKKKKEKKNVFIYYKSNTKFMHFNGNVSLL